MPLSPRVTDAILSLLADTVSDDVTRESISRALISTDGKRLVATDGVSLVQVDLSCDIGTSGTGDRLNPDAARKMIKAGLSPQRSVTDSAFPDYARVIPAKIGREANSEGRYDANTPPNAGFDALLLARVLSGIGKVAKTAGQKQAGVVFQYSDGLTPARIDLTGYDGAETVTIVAVVMPMRV